MMKLAVISFTVNGTRLNWKLCATLSEKLKTNAAARDEILIFGYVKSKQSPVLEEAGKQPECMVWQRPLNDWAREMFGIHGCFDFYWSHGNRGACDRAFGAG